MAELDPQVLGDELMTAVSLLRRLVRARVRVAMPGPRLRGGHVELLRIVQQQPGIGVAAAARGLHLAANSVSTLVNQLTDEGLLIRSTDPVDRRAVRLYLTEPAERRLAAWRAARIQLVGAAVAGLSEMDQKSLEAALPALQALIGRFDDDAEDG